jgi:integrase/recombinase XerC
MAAERGRGISARSLARALSAVRSFYNWLDAAEGIDCAAIHVVRSPKLPARLPRPVPEAGARAIVSAISADAEPWIAARDQAALTLIWGSGLRISEALGLRQGDAPLAEVIRVTGKPSSARCRCCQPRGRRSSATALSAPLRPAATTRCFWAPEAGR